MRYDLSNTPFEESAAANPQSKFGRSKDERTDCRLLSIERLASHLVHSIRCWLKQ